MEADSLTILPLVDEPVAHSKPTAMSMEERRRNVRQRLSETLDHLMLSADSEGFATVNYGQLLSSISHVTGESADFLMENGWILRSHLENQGMASAPDAMLERRHLRPTDSIVLYRTDKSVPFIRRRPYKKGVLLVKFVTLAFQPLTPVEMTMIGSMIEQWTPNPLYARHVKALLRWFDSRRRLLDKRTVATFSEITDEADRRLLASQLLDMAAARGSSITPRSIDQLDRLLTMCGHLRGEVHTLLHRHHTGTPLSSASTVSSVAPEGVDPSLINTVESDTSQVRLLLAEVFDDNPQGVVESNIRTPDAAPENRLFPIIRQLMERDHWTLAEVREMAAGSLPATPISVVLEEINDLAIDKIGDTVVDVEDDNVFVTTDFAEEILAP